MLFSARCTLGTNNQGEAVFAVICGRVVQFLCIPEVSVQSTHCNEMHASISMAYSAVDMNWVSILPMPWRNRFNIVSQRQIWLIFVAHGSREESDFIRPIRVGRNAPCSLHLRIQDRCVH